MDLLSLYLFLDTMVRQPSDSVRVCVMERDKISAVSPTTTALKCGKGFRDVGSVNELVAERDLATEFGQPKAAWVRDFIQSL